MQSGPIMKTINRLNPDGFDLSWTHQMRWTAPPRVALTGEVFSPGMQVSSRRLTSRHVLPVNLFDTEVRWVQVQAVGGVVALPDAAALPLAQDLTAEHGSCCHIGDVRVEGGCQVLGQRLTGSLNRGGGVYRWASGVVGKKKVRYGLS